LASLYKRTGYYGITFRYAGKKYNRTLKTTNQDEAENTRKLAEATLYKLTNGDLSIPNDVDFVTFVISGGKRAKVPEPPQTLTLKKLVEEYKESVKESVEPTTFTTIGIHTGHFLRILGPRFNPRTLKQEHLQNYISTRQADVAPCTVRKEITTLGAIWSWASEDYELPAFPSKRKLRYRKSAEKPPFQTWEEIEQQIARGALTDKQIAGLWECLFLSLDQVEELLAYVKENAIQPFLYPMVVMGAHTGARRSELIRSRIIDFQDDIVIIHERKRSKEKQTTRRVPLSTLARGVIKKWFEEHPGGQYTFCQRKSNGPQALTGYQAHHHLKRTLSGSKWEVLKGWHVLRHSFISNCALKAIDQRIIDSFVGHTTEEMRRRYTHLFPSAKKDAIKSVFG